MGRPQPVTARRPSPWQVMMAADVHDAMEMMGELAVRSLTSIM